MRRICVFCGASNGSDPDFQKVTKQLGKAIAEKGFELVYGAGCVGLMGVLADATLSAGGKVIGVIPESLVAKELAHRGLTELHIVKTMHERKAMMADLADGFIAMPGGYGTLDEFCEIITWSQLGFHKKPCAILNVKGYFDHLIKFFDTAQELQFVASRHREMILISTDPLGILDEMVNYRHHAQEKWVSKKDL